MGSLTLVLILSEIPAVGGYYFPKQLRYFFSKGKKKAAPGKEAASFKFSYNTSCSGPG